MKGDLRVCNGETIIKFSPHAMEQLKDRFYCFWNQINKSPSLLARRIRSAEVIAHYQYRKENRRWCDSIALFMRTSNKRIFPIATLKKNVLYVETFFNPQIFNNLVINHNGNVRDLYVKHDLITKLKLNKVKKYKKPNPTN